METVPFTYLLETPKERNHFLNGYQDAKHCRVRLLHAPVPYNTGYTRWHLADPKEHMFIEDMMARWNRRMK